MQQKPIRHSTHRYGYLIGLLVLSGCTSFTRPSEHVRHVPKTTGESSKYQQVAKASWYGPGLQGKPTASGEIFDQNKLTAGSRDLPLGTVVEVTNLKNHRKVEVKLNYSPSKDGGLAGGGINPRLKRFAVG